MMKIETLMKSVGSKPGVQHHVHSRAIIFIPQNYLPEQEKIKFRLLNLN